MFIVKNGKLIPMQKPKANVTSQKEASPAETAFTDTRSSVHSSQVQSKFIHFFKVATDDTQKFQSQEEKVVSNKFSNERKTRPISANDEKEDCKNEQIFLDESEYH